MGKRKRKPTKHKSTWGKTPKIPTIPRPVAPNALPGAVTLRKAATTWAAGLGQEPCNGEDSLMAQADRNLRSAAVRYAKELWLQGPHYGQIIFQDAGVRQNGKRLMRLFGIIPVNEDTKLRGSTQYVVAASDEGSSSCPAPGST